MVNLKKSQKGIALLIFVIILLVILSTIVVTASRSTLLEVRMTSNYVDSKVAFNSSNAGAKYALEELNLSFNINDFIGVSQKAGYYDLRRENPGSAREQAEWDALVRMETLDDTGALITTTAQYSLDSLPSYLESGDVVSPSIAPRYAIGIHDPALRAGTEGMNCIPVSILGIGNGGIKSSLSIVEVKTIPRAGCFRDMAN